MKQFSAVIIKGERGYIARCMELNIASQGETSEEARAGLHEAVQVYFESAARGEIPRRSLSDPKCRGKN